MTLEREHTYLVDVAWTGNRGEGTTSDEAYERAHEVRADGKPTIAGSSDPSFRGDPTRWNPEELLVAALAQCHLLWYLHLAAVSGVVVTDYCDAAVGRMVISPDGSGRFTEVVLRPLVVVTDASMIETATELHDRAHQMCFVASSVAFPVRHEPRTRLGR
jgi:organic hydroperoxide reductase OsmC/OhrA